MKKALITTFAIIFSIFILHFIVGEVIESVYQTEAETYLSLIGESVALKRDTLMIVNYSMLNETFTLDNGNVISVELANKLILKEEK